MISGVNLAELSELVGLLPYLSAAMLAKEVYSGTFTVSFAFLWIGIAAGSVALEALFSSVASIQNHSAAFTITRNIRRAILDKMQCVPMGMIY